MHFNQSNDTQYVDVCVVGMGVSSLALVRQLEQENASYLVVSEKDFGIWEAVAERGDDFDLQSSIPTSAFSWWKELDKEGFLYYSASEYYARLKADIAGKIEQRIVRERATSYVEQEDGAYAVYTNRDSESVEPRIICKHLVITAGVSTGNHQITDLMEQSLQIQDKTVFIDGYGDTALMLMGRLMLGNNRVIIGTAHFQNLDKVQRPARWNSNWIPLEFYEEHKNKEFNNHELGYGVYWHAGVSPYSNFWLSSLFRKQAGLDDLFPVEDYLQNDLASSLQGLVTRRGVSAGFGLPGKYWPVDGYFSFYDNGHKEHMLNHRMLLNDPYYFMQLGLVKVVHSKRIEWVTDKDCLIDGDAVTVDEKFVINPSRPRPVQIEQKDGQAWKYDYRSFLHGIWSAEQPNVYFLGTERPTAGSYASTGEMQCAFIHQLITDEVFRCEMIKKYDKIYQSWQHNYLNSGTCFEEIIYSQFSGTTNQALARLMGVQRKLWPSLLKGKLFEYYAGTVIPARFDSLTHVGKEYSDFCRRWTHSIGLNVFARATYVYTLALNLVALGLFVGSVWILILGLLLFVPVIQKLVKVLIHDTLCYGLDAGVYEHISLIFLTCTSLNLAGFAMGVTLDGAAAWVWMTLLTGLPVAFVTMIVDIIRSYRKDKLLFNDIRDHHQFSDRIKEYLTEVRETDWYKRYAQSQKEELVFDTEQKVYENLSQTQSQEASNMVTGRQNELADIC